MTHEELIMKNYYNIQKCIKMLGMIKDDLDDIFNRLDKLEMCWDAQCQINDSTTELLRIK